MWVPIMEETAGGGERQASYEGFPLWRMKCNCKMNGQVRWGFKMGRHKCASTGCMHLGDKQAEIPAACCGGKETVFACGVFGSCTIYLVDEKIKCCDGCERQEPVKV